mmetsp:Transcript_113083/g.200527  ORF Transcript_113083/g.200527 Transcript_113083/m.200527 type:complete len:608 (+) Transcript_113083:46-1869(+)
MMTRCLFRISLNMHMIAIGLFSVAAQGHGSKQTPDEHATAHNALKELATLILAMSSSPTGWQLNGYGRHLAMEQSNNNHVAPRSAVLMQSVVARHKSELTDMQKMILQNFQQSLAAKNARMGTPSQWVVDRATAKRMLKIFVEKNMRSSVLSLYEAAKESKGNFTQHAASPLVLRALAEMEEYDEMSELYMKHTLEYPNETHMSSTRVVFSALCTHAFVDEAEELLDILRRKYPWPSESHDYDPEYDKDGTQEPMWHRIGTSFIPMLARAFIRRGKRAAALQLTKELISLTHLFTPAPLTLVGLMKDFAKARCLEGVYDVIDLNLNSKRKTNIFERRALDKGVVEALHKKTRFDGSYVTLQHLPDSKIPEVALLGRSNVGKSSLINMVLDRNQMAHVSNKPGKTRNYNYFEINRPKPGERAYGNWHLVDMPGLGYARVPRRMRDGWAAFFEEYTAQREQLKVVMHLVDSRDGIQPVDIQIMEMLRDAAPVATGPDGQCRWEYVIVLTKSDKRDSRCRKTRESIQQALEEVGGLTPSAIIDTSSKDKTGRFEMWKMLKPVVVSKQSNARMWKPEDYIPPPNDINRRLKASQIKSEEWLGRRKTWKVVL